MSEPIDYEDAAAEVRYVATSLASADCSARLEAAAKLCEREPLVQRLLELIEGDFQNWIVEAAEAVREFK